MKRRGVAFVSWMSGAALISAVGLVGCRADAIQPRLERLPDRTAFEYCDDMSQPECTEPDPGGGPSYSQEPSEQSSLIAYDDGSGGLGSSYVNPPVNDGYGTTRVAWYDPPMFSAYPDGVEASAWTQIVSGIGVAMVASTIYMYDGSGPYTIYRSATGARRAQWGPLHFIGTCALRGMDVEVSSYHRIQYGTYGVGGNVSNHKGCSPGSNRRSTERGPLSYDSYNSGGTGKVCWYQDVYVSYDGGNTWGEATARFCWG